MTDSQAKRPIKTVLKDNYIFDEGYQRMIQFCFARYDIAISVPGGWMFFPDEETYQAYEKENKNGNSNSVRS